MKHVKALTSPNTVRPEKALDDVGSIFLQIWATVFTTILLGAFGLKR